jgi:hypothetical protein
MERAESKDFGGAVGTAAQQTNGTHMGRKCAMRERTQPVKFTVDLYTRLCLTVIAVLLTVLIAGLWADGVRLAGPATAAEKFLDSAAQREAIVKAQEQGTEKLDELLRLLESGKVKVQVVQQEESGKPAGGQDAAPAKTAK